MFQIFFPWECSPVQSLICGEWRIRYPPSQLFCCLVIHTEWRIRYPPSQLFCCLVIHGEWHMRYPPSQLFCCLVIHGKWHIMYPPSQLFCCLITGSTIDFWACLSLVSAPAPGCLHPHRLAGTVRPPTHTQSCLGQGCADLSSASLQ